MLAGVAAIISWGVITVGAVGITWAVYGIYCVFLRYRVFATKCATCTHAPHHDGPCSYNQPPLTSRCARCKHPHERHIGDACAGAVENYEQSMFGYKRVLIDPTRYNMVDGVITLHTGVPAYVHSNVRSVEVDESYVVGYKDVEYTELTSVPTGKKQTRRIKKKRVEKKQVAVEKTRTEQAKSAGPRAVVESVATSTYGMITPSRLERTYVDVPVNVWVGSGYKTSYRREERCRTIPAVWGQIPVRTTSTRYVYDDLNNARTIDVKYIANEWQDVETEYSTDEEVDVVDLKYVNKTRKSPIMATRKVHKPQTEYSFTCACRACLCPRCVYKRCECARCDCMRCRMCAVAYMISVIIPIITTSIFIGVVPIVFGIDSIVNEWASLLYRDINYGFVLIIAGVSFLVAIIVVVIWAASERSNIATTRRFIALAIILAATVATQLASLATCAAIPIIVWLRQLPIDVLPCYITAAGLVVVYLAAWLVVARFKNRIYGHDLVYYVSIDDV